MDKDQAQADDPSSIPDNKLGEEKVLNVFINQKVEVNKNIQDFIYKSFYKKKNEKTDGPHEFWDTQPVPSFSSKITVK